MRIMMCAGEASGDMHGSHLARAITARYPQARMYGMGGPLMAAAGVDVLFDPTAHSTIGLVESLRQVRPLRRIVKQLEMILIEEAPDVFVAIDFPSVNLRLVRTARMYNIPIVYYFSPTAWLWGARRAELLANTGAIVCAVLPREARFYRDAGAKTVYVGHPLLDTARCDDDAATARRALRLDPTKPVVALLPGSRTQEWQRHLPPMADAYAALRQTMPGLQAVIPAAHTANEALLRQLAPAEGIRIVHGSTPRALRAADAALVTAGTATLEAAIVGTPQACVYRLSPLSYAIVKRMVKGGQSAMPNILAGRTIVPELLQHDMTADNMAAMLRSIMQPDAASRMRHDYAQVRQLLGEGGAADRVAGIVVATGQKADIADYALPFPESGGAAEGDA